MYEYSESKWTSWKDIYTQFWILLIDLKSFKSHRHKTMSLRPLDKSKRLSPVFIVRFWCLSTQNECRENLRLVCKVDFFNQWSIERDILKKCIFYFLKYVFSYLVFPPDLLTKMIINKPILNFLDKHFEYSNITIGQ